MNLNFAISLCLLSEAGRQAEVKEVRTEEGRKEGKEERKKSEGDQMSKVDCSIRMLRRSHLVVR